METVWKSIDVDPAGGNSIIFQQVLGDKAGDVAYVYQLIYCAKEKQAGLLFSADDRHWLWFNGELLSEGRSKGATPEDQFGEDDFAIPVKLRQGWNSVLVKVRDELTGGHGLSMRLTDDDATLASAFDRTHQYADAIRHWDLEIAKNPLNRALLLQRAASRWALGDQSGAESDLADFIAGKENDPTLLEQRGRVNLEMGRELEGHQDYDRAIALAPDRISLRRSCLTQKTEVGQAKRSVGAFGLSLQTIPGFSGIRSLACHH